MYTILVTAPNIENTPYVKLFIVNSKGSLDFWTNWKLLISRINAEIEWHEFKSRHVLRNDRWFIVCKTKNLEPKKIKLLKFLILDIFYYHLDKMINDEVLFKIECCRFIYFILNRITAWLSTIQEHAKPSEELD